MNYIYHGRLLWKLSGQVNSSTGDVPIHLFCHLLLYLTLCESRRNFYFRKSKDLMSPIYKIEHLTNCGSNDEARAAPSAQTAPHYEHQSTRIGREQGSIGTHSSGESTNYHWNTFQRIKLELRAAELNAEQFTSTSCPHNHPRESE